MELLGIMLNISYIAGMTVLYIGGHWVVATTSIVSLFVGIMMGIIGANK